MRNFITRVDLKIRNFLERESLIIFKNFNVSMVNLMTTNSRAYIMINMVRCMMVKWWMAGIMGRAN